MRRAAAHKWDVSCGFQQTSAWHTVGVQQISSDWLTRDIRVLNAMNGSHVRSAATS